MSRKVFVVGVGMTNFEVPNRRKDFDYPQMVKKSVTAALKDAGLKYEQVEQAVAGYIAGDTTSGQRALNQLGMTGIPIYNVSNACASGGAALYMARNLIAGGIADCVLSVGFEKNEPSHLENLLKYPDRKNPWHTTEKFFNDRFEKGDGPIVPQLFGRAAEEYIEKYQTSPRTLAKIAHKNLKHARGNIRSMVKEEYTLQDVLDSHVAHGPLTKLQCCPQSDGSAAAILASEDFVKAFGLEDQAVEIIGMKLGTDTITEGEESCLTKLGYQWAAKCAKDVFEEAGVTPEDVQVIELHDCFSISELMHYETLGLCQPGEAEELVEREDNTYGGKWVINPSGGLEGKGHPYGATGVAQCVEIVEQLRGMSGHRQVEDARCGLTHNLGIGGAVVIGIYKRPESLD